MGEIMKMMRTMDHKNVVKLYEIIDDPADDKLYLIMEFCNGGDMASLCQETLDNGYGPSPEKFQNVFSQILFGLDYLHNRLRVAHCDLKPANILLQENGGILTV